MEEQNEIKELTQAFVGNAWPPDTRQFCAAGCVITCNVPCCGQQYTAGDSHRLTSVNARDVPFVLWVQQYNRCLEGCKLSVRRKGIMCSVSLHRMNRTALDCNRTALDCNRTALDYNGTALDCNGTALDCNRTALDCNRTALDCNGTVLDCNITALDCNRTALDCNRTALDCNRTALDCNSFIPFVNNCIQFQLLMNVGQLINFKVFNVKLTL